MAMAVRVFPQPNPSQKAGQSLSRCFENSCRITAFLTFRIPKRNFSPWMVFAPCLTGFCYISARAVIAAPAHLLARKCRFFAAEAAKSLCFRVLFGKSPGSTSFVHCFLVHGCVAVWAFLLVPAKGELPGAADAAAFRDHLLPPLETFI